MVIIKDVRLSLNPESEVEQYENGIDGKINITSDGARYCIVEIYDITNPFNATTRIMNYRERQKDKWKGLTPKELKLKIGDTLPGARTVTREVKPYEIDGRIVTTYSTIILPKDSIKTVFKSSDKLLIESFVDSNGEEEEVKEVIEIR